MSRFVEFFEAENQRLSMTRLLCFLSFFPSSYVVIFHATEGILGWYIGGYVLGYVGGKAADTFTSMAQIKADGPPANVVVPDAKNVNVKADGNVNVTQGE
jgi:hypothetical protein